MALANDETKDAVTRLDRKNAIICLKAEKIQRMKEKSWERLC